MDKGKGKPLLFGTSPYPHIKQSAVSHGGNGESYSSSRAIGEPGARAAEAQDPLEYRSVAEL